MRTAPSAEFIVCVRGSWIITVQHPWFTTMKHNTGRTIHNTTSLVPVCTFTSITEKPAGAQCQTRKIVSLSLLFLDLKDLFIYQLFFKKKYYIFLISLSVLIFNTPTSFIRYSLIRNSGLSATLVLNKKSNVRNKL